MNDTGARLTCCDARHGVASRSVKPYTRGGRFVNAVTCTKLALAPTAPSEDLAVGSQRQRVVDAAGERRNPQPRRHGHRGRQLAALCDPTTPRRCSRRRFRLVEHPLWHAQAPVRSRSCATNVRWTASRPCRNGWATYRALVPLAATPPFASATTVKPRPQLAARHGTPQRPRFVPLRSLAVGSSREVTTRRRASHVVTTPDANVHALDDSP